MSERLQSIIPPNFDQGLAKLYLLVWALRNKESRVKRELPISSEKIIETL